MTAIELGVFLLFVAIAFFISGFLIGRFIQSMRYNEMRSYVDQLLDEVEELHKHLRNTEHK